MEHRKYSKILEERKKGLRQAGKQEGRKQRKEGRKEGTKKVSDGLNNLIWLENCM